MPALTTGLILAGSAALLGQAGKMAGGYIANKPLESDLERQEELKRLQEADALGLTGQERSAYMSSFVDPARALAAQQMQQNAALQTMAQDSGGTLRRLRAEEEQAQRAQSEANRQVEMLNMQQAQLQEAELRALNREIDQRRQAQRAALVGGGLQMAGTATGMAGQYYAQQELISRGANDPAAMGLAQVAGVASPYGYNYNSYLGGQQAPMGGYGYGGGGQPPVIIVQGGGTTVPQQ